MHCCKISWQNLFCLANIYLVLKKGSWYIMKRIKTVQTKDLKDSVKKGGCGECQTSCQSACKTSCGVANQKCENCNG